MSCLGSLSSLVRLDPMNFVESTYLLVELSASQTVRTSILDNDLGGDSWHKDESTWFALAAAYNSCISRVLDFRWRHWSF